MGSLLASASFDGRICIWQFQNYSRELVKLYETRGEASQNGVEWAPSRFPLLGAVASNGVITLAYMQNFDWVHCCRGERGESALTALCWAPAPVQEILAANADMQYFAVVGCDRRLAFYSFEAENETLELIYVIENCHARWVRDVSWSTASVFEYQQIATASEDGCCSVWAVDLPSQTHSQRTIIVGVPVWRATWNALGTLLALGLTAADGGNEVRVYSENENGEWKVASALQ